MSNHSHDSGSNAHENTSKGIGLKVPVVAIAILLIVYVVLLMKGVPQGWTVLHNAEGHHEEQHLEPGATETPETPVGTQGEEGAETQEEGQTPVTEEQTPPEEKETGEQPAESKTVHEEGKKPHPPYWMIAPFACLLLCIALLPLIPATEHWWESNTNRFIVAAALGFITLCYYYFACDFPVELHWPGHQVVDPAKVGGFGVVSAIFLNAIVADYIPFIVLLFSLFTITGGIRIDGDLKASPKTNAVILMIGAVMASFIGTTGAAMLLIRLLLETNQQRKYKVHTVVMFIFVVCNCGGCLTPLGDPPLFLGYLKGIDFTWTLFALWPMWLFVNIILIGVYFLWDTIWFYPKESAADKAADEAEQRGLKITGLGLNLPLLVGVVLAVALLAPGKPLPGTGTVVDGVTVGGWYPWMFLREAVQLGLCAISLFMGSKAIRKANSFNFSAIGEVAALFFGIFICMQVPLQILNFEGKNLVETVQAKTGVKETQLFFWSTGTLSSVLDNAPTYVVFMETARSLSPNTEEELKVDPKWKDEYEKGNMIPVGKTGFIDHFLLVAIALGAVFMGAMTYIGNGPNFMVKAIAEQSGVKMPSFFGYMGYSICILIPIFIIMTLIFLR